MSWAFVAGSALAACEVVAELGDQIPWPVRALGGVEGEFGGVEDAGDGVDGFACGLAGEVAVDVRGGRQGAVAQGLGDDHEGDAAVEGEGGGEVAQVVDGDAGDAGLVAQLLEVREDVLRVERPAVVLEDVAVGGDREAEEVVVGEVFEDAAGAVVDGDPAEAALGLGAVRTVYRLSTAEKV